MPREAARQYLLSRVNSGAFPRYLYKYRPLYQYSRGQDKPDLLPNTTAILTKAEMWHSAPTAFNDPFDCQLALDQRYSDSIVRSMAKLLETPQHQAPGQRKLRRQGLQNLRRNTKFTVAKAQALIRNAMTGTGLCSYGTRGDNLLMWAHYSDSHRGLCMKFDVLADPEAFFDMMPVTYSHDYPSIKNVSEESIRQVLTVKADVWAYEQEWRVFTRTGPGNKAFRKAALVEVIFGAQAAADPVEAFAEILDADPDYAHVQLRQAQLSKRSFSLELHNYN